MKKLLTAIALAAVAASPAMAAKARHGKTYLQADPYAYLAPYGNAQRAYDPRTFDTWNSDPNIRDRQERDYPDFH